MDVFVIGVKTQAGLANGTEDEPVLMLTQDEILTMFQRNPDGDPVDELQTAAFTQFQILSVEPYEVYLSVTS